jgi:hypothetical protein
MIDHAITHVLEHHYGGFDLDAPGLIQLDGYLAQQIQILWADRDPALGFLMEYTLYCTQQEGRERRIQWDRPEAVAVPWGWQAQQLTVRMRPVVDWDEVLGRADFRQQKVEVQGQLRSLQDVILEFALGHSVFAPPHVILTVAGEDAAQVQTLGEILGAWVQARVALGDDRAAAWPWIYWGTWGTIAGVGVLAGPAIVALRFNGSPSFALGVGLLLGTVALGILAWGGPRWERKIDRWITGWCPRARLDLPQVPPPQGTTPAPPHPLGLAPPNDYPLD